jgi:hypothetical protein
MGGRQPGVISMPMTLLTARTANSRTYVPLDGRPPKADQRPAIGERAWHAEEADAGTRTPDPLLTMEVLYRLSYVGASDES